MFFYVIYIATFIVGYFSLYALSLVVPVLNHQVPVYVFLSCLGVVTLFNWVMAKKMVAALRLQYENTDKVIDEVTSIQELVRRHNENYICIDKHKLKRYLDSHGVEVNLDDFMGVGMRI